MTGIETLGLKRKEKKKRRGLPSPPVDNHSQGKINVLQWGLTGYVNHTYWKASFLEVDGQYKVNSMVFCRLFCIRLLHLGIFYLSGLLLAYYGF